MGIALNAMSDAAQARVGRDGMHQLARKEHQIAGFGLRTDPLVGVVRASLCASMVILERKLDTAGRLAKIAPAVGASCVSAAFRPGGQRGRIWRAQRVTTIDKAV